MNRIDDTEWICPHCSAKNIDSYIDTAIPVCGKCGRWFFWITILTPEQFEKAQIILKESMEN